LGGHLRADALYWAAGGLVGGETLGVEIDRLAHKRDASFVAGLWAAFALKALAATLAQANSQTCLDTFRHVTDQLADASR
jgi:hypothetical protein